MLAVSVRRHFTGPIVQFSSLKAAWTRKLKTARGGRRESPTGVEELRNVMCRLAFVVFKKEKFLNNLAEVLLGTPHPPSTSSDPTFLASRAPGGGISGYLELRGWSHAQGGL